jgi:hypothetical protein
MLNFLLKKKVTRIADETKTVVRRIGGANCTVLSLGAYDVDPRLLVYVVQVATDAERNKLKERPALADSLRELPAKNGWPDSACEDVTFHVESQETVDRENEGNWGYRYG